VSPEALLTAEGLEGTLGVLAGMRAQARASLAEARQRVANLPRDRRPAFLPLALVGPYLRAMERRGREALREPAEISPLARVTRIAAAHWLGRI
jgi:phytoene synthase